MHQIWNSETKNPVIFLVFFFFKLFHGFSVSYVWEMIFSFCLDRCLLFMNLVLLTNNWITELAESSFWVAFEGSMSVLTSEERIDLGYIWIERFEMKDFKSRILCEIQISPSKFNLRISCDILSLLTACYSFLLLTFVPLLGECCSMYCWCSFEVSKSHMVLW